VGAGVLRCRSCHFITRVTIEYISLADNSFGCAPSNCKIVAAVEIQSMLLLCGFSHTAQQPTTNSITNITPSRRTRNAFPDTSPPTPLKISMDWLSFNSL
jgi:hypothetical protein